jgi:hypothetical protein
LICTTTSKTIDFHRNNGVGQLMGICDRDDVWWDRWWFGRECRETIEKQVIANQDVFLPPNHAKTLLRLRQRSFEGVQ